MLISITDAENSFVWNIGILRRKYDMNDPQQKTEFEHIVAEQLCSFSEPLERDNYTRSVSNKYMIPYEDLKRLVNSMGNKGYGTNAGKPPFDTARIRRTDDGLKKTQSFIISCISADEDLKKEVLSYLSADDFEGELYKLVVSELGNGNSCAQILNRYCDDSDKTKEIAGILNYSADDINEDMKSALASAIVRIKLSSLEKKSNEATDLNDLQSIIKEQAKWKNKKILL